MSQLIDISGQRFGRIVAIKHLSGTRGDEGNWLGVCDCGTTKKFCSRDLRRGKSKSCGCLQRELVATRRKISPEQREELIQLYVKGGMAAIVQQAKELRINEKYIANLASQRRLRCEAERGCFRDTHKDKRWKWAIERGAVVA